MPNQYGEGVHLGALHYLLWQRRTGEDVLRITQKALAEELALSRQRVTQVVADLIAEERLFQTSERYVYRLADPADFPDGTP